jgi:hypothetical protein
MLIMAKPAGSDRLRERLALFAESTGRKGYAPMARAAGSMFLARGQSPEGLDAIAFGICWPGGPGFS